MDFKIQPVSDFGAEIAKFGGTAYVKAPRCLRHHGISFAADLKS